MSLLEQRKQNWLKFKEEKINQSDEQTWKDYQALRRWLQRNKDKTEDDWLKMRAKKKNRNNELNSRPKKTSNLTAIFKEKPGKRQEELELKMDDMKTIESDRKQNIIANILEAHKEKFKGKDTEIVHKTIDRNLKRINTLHEYLFDKKWDFKDFEWLKNTTNVIVSIADHPSWADTTQLGYLSGINGILKYFPNMKEYYKIYSKEIMKQKKPIDERGKTGEFTKTQEKKFAKGKTLMKWPDIVNVDVSDSNGGWPFIQALHAIYTELPPRRLEYRLIKLVREDKTKVDKLSKKSNYLVVSKKYLPKTIIINTFKSPANYRWRRQGKGEYVVDLTLHKHRKLQQALHKLVLDEDLDANDYLFHLDADKKKGYTHNEFSKLISKNLFEDWTGVKLTNTYLREAYVSWHLYEKGYKTAKEQDEMAYQMGTSMSEMITSYRKNKLTRDQEGEGDDEADELLDEIMNEM